MTTQTSLPQNDDRMDRAIGYSVAFHVALFAIFAVRAFFSPSLEIPTEHAIRVDIVSLPDKPAAKLPPMEKPQETEPERPKPVPAEKTPPKPEPVAIPKAEIPKVNLKQTKRDEQAALRRIEALSKLQNASQPQSEEKPEPRPQPALPQPVKGNEVAQGSSLKGIAKLENERYSEVVQNHITRHWNLPGFLANANLSALVRVFVDSQGNLLKKLLVKSSGNPVFDQSALQAVEASLPLPRPPSDLVNLVSVRGLDIDFTPEH